MDLRICLNERREDLSVLSEVTQESVAAPPSHGLHRFYGHTAEQVEEGGSNPDAMPLKRLQAGQPCSCCQPLNESCLGEGTQLPFVSICKEVVI